MCWSLQRSWGRACPLGFCHLVATVSFEMHSEEELTVPRCRAGRWHRRAAPAGTMHGSVSTTLYPPAVTHGRMTRSCRVSQVGITRNPQKTQIKLPREASHYDLIRVPIVQGAHLTVSGEHVSRDASSLLDDEEPLPTLSLRGSKNPFFPSDAFIFLSL